VSCSSMALQGVAQLLLRVMAECSVDLLPWCSQFGVTSLIAASSNGHAAVVAQLLGAKGIDVNAAEMNVSALLVPPCTRTMPLSALGIT
jgi:hypothetical protein